LNFGLRDGIVIYDSAQFLDPFPEIVRNTAIAPPGEPFQSLVQFQFSDLLASPRQGSGVVRAGSPKSVAGGFINHGYFSPSSREVLRLAAARLSQDRKSTRLNSSHLVISYAVFCLKKKM